VVYVYTVLLSILLIGESPSAVRLCGIAMIMVGVVFVGKS